MVLLTALIRGLAAKFGCIDLLTSGPWSEPLLRGQPAVGTIVTVRSRKTPYWLSLDQQRAVRWLRSRGAGPTWYCDANDAARPMLIRAGIALDHMVDVKEHPLLPGEHATQQWCRLARMMPAALASPALPAAPGAGRARRTEEDVGGEPGGCCLEVSQSQRLDLESWLRGLELGSVPLIAVQVGNKRTMRRGPKRLAPNNKYWPNERWAAVLRHIRHSRPEHAIVMLGTAPEYRLNQEIADCAAVDRLYNVADELPIPRLVALLAHARALLTVDSGPAHVAAAVGCPQVVLFGKALPSLYRPWGTAGADARVLTGEADGEPSMLGIDVPTVVAAWDELALRTG
jgi:heptosyltransferase-2/heptosyltransferase-3